MFQPGPTVAACHLAWCLSAYFLHSVLSKADDAEELDVQEPMDSSHFLDLLICITSGEEKGKGPALDLELKKNSKVYIHFELTATSNGPAGASGSRVRDRFQLGPTRATLLCDLANGRRVRSYYASQTLASKIFLAIKSIYDVEKHATFGPSIFRLDVNY